MSKQREQAARRMARVPAKRRSRAGATRKPGPTSPALEIEALEGVPPEPEDGQRETGAEGSVQAPLEDSPETDADRWLLDRPGEGVEEPGR